MRGFHPPAKNPAVARGFRPASAAAAQAQALNQAPDSIHAMVKPGEFVLPPDTVHAMGGPDALQGMVNATHTPVRGFIPRAKIEEPRQFFANGGMVEDEPKRSSSFGDAAAAASNPGTVQIGSAPAQRGRGFSPAANASPAPANWNDTIAKVEAMGFKQNPAQPSAGPSYATTAHGFVPTGPATQPTAVDAPGAGRGFAGPVGAKAGTPEAQQALAVAGKEVIPGVFNHGRGQYSDDPSGMNMPAGFTGTPSAANNAILERMSDQSKAESMARVMSGQQPQPVGFQAPTVRHSGNDWQARNDLRNAEVSAGSITNTRKWGGPGAENNPDVLKYKAMLAADNAARGFQPGLDQEAMRQNGSLQREGMQQAGETSRTQLQQALADIRERRATKHQAFQEDIARQRLALDTGRAALAGVPNGYRPKADGTLEAIPGGPADPNTQAGKKPLNDTQAKALQFGARMQQAGQSLDALASDGATQPGYIKRAADVVGAGALANWTQSPQQQQVEQSQRDFVNAVLRRESGAAISNSEFDNARQQYFPQPGDSAKVIEQKRRNRELATRGVLAEVPDQQNRVQQVLGATGQAQQGQQRAVARTGTINGRKVVQYADGSIDYAD